MVFTDNQLHYIAMALQRRQPLLQQDCRHRGAWRLFNGFTEGIPELTIDILAQTAVINDYSPEGFHWQQLTEMLSSQLSFLQCVLLKRRHSEDPAERNGQIISGQKAADQIEENQVRYAVDPVMNHDNSFYSDTRYLRKYLLENMRGKSVLNTFAYTGSLGVAAAAGGAARVLQTDLSGKFLQTAYRSASLNGLSFTRKNFRYGDFFPVVSALRREGEKFDCVVVDPPFFSRTAKGVIDLANNPLGVVNKVRPLVADNGVLIVVNNSLYLSGEDFRTQINSICDGCYLSWEQAIPIPDDFCYCAENAARPYPADPSPFNHPTKIVVLRVHC